MKKLLFLLLFLAFSFNVMALREERKFIASDVQRAYAVVLTPHGYFPKKLQVFRGETVQFYATSTRDEPGCMVLEGHDLFLGATKGRLSEGRVKFNQAGKFRFHCPSYKFVGEVEVLLKTKDKIKQRSPASTYGGEEKKSYGPRYWMPKDY